MNKIIDFVLKNRLLMIVLAALIIAGGYYSYEKLPIDAFPDVSPNLVQVFTVTEGLAPEEVEKYVTYPVEVAMNGLPNLKNIRSVSNFGLSVVNVYFDDGADIYFSRQLVNERLQEAREQIPEGFGDPVMGPISTGMGLVLFYYIEDTTGQYSLQELRTIQDWLIKFQLQTVPGVTEVLGIGGWEKQYHTVLDPNALLRYDVTVNEIIDKIKANNLNVGAQFVEKMPRNSSCARWAWLPISRIWKILSSRRKTVSRFICGNWLTFAPGAPSDAGCKPATASAKWFPGW